MKKIKVSVAAELELPDDFEIINDPADGLLLKKGGQCYMPVFQWLAAPAGAKGAEHDWTAADEDAVNLLVDATQSEECKIKAER
jgi:hypothetical protein